MSKSTGGQGSGDFKFHSGRPSLDLAATLGSRGFLNIERLRDETDLARWLCLAGLTGSSAQARPSDLRAALELREAIWRAVSADAQAPLPPAAVRVLNRWAGEPSLVPQISASRALSWQDPQALQDALSTIARDAIFLLTGPSRMKIKQCARAGCTILFVDASRNGRRRWCSMDDCGNAVKGAAFVARRRERGERNREASRSDVHQHEEAPPST
jgi:predicted RNA-binding Zn ribbon-like protein